MRFDVLRGCTAGAVVTMVALASGCQGDAEPGEHAPRTPWGSAQAPAIAPSGPEDALAKVLREKASSVAPHMDPFGELLRGTLARGAAEDFQLVLYGERCYRFVGAGADDVLDLDLLLFDPSGSQLAQDTAMDEAPMLGVRNPVCPATTGAYRLQARMHSGSGEFAIRVFSSR